MNSETHELKILLHSFLKTVQRTKNSKRLDKREFIMTWTNTLSESLILAQDERWRRA